MIRNDYNSPGFGFLGFDENLPSSCGGRRRRSDSPDNFPYFGSVEEPDLPNQASSPNESAIASQAPVDVYEFVGEDSYHSGRDTSQMEAAELGETYNVCQLESGEIVSENESIISQFADPDSGNADQCQVSCPCEPSRTFRASLQTPVAASALSAMTPRSPSPIKVSTRLSPARAWQRVYHKYSPSTEVFLSPIKQVQANLHPLLETDALMYGQTWLLSMSEQFFYDNAILLLHRYKDRLELLRGTLRFNCQPIDGERIAATMVDVNILGSGTYGDVYRVRKAHTAEYYAIKYLKKTPADGIFEHTQSLLDYIKEKTFLVRAHNSPFVVQFFSSVKFPGVGGLFLFFEWCLTDLRKYVNMVSTRTNVYTITRNLYDGVEDGIDQVMRDVYDHFDVDMFPTSLVYVFEVMCALDFLARCAIVHQDLKPENFMIGQNLHLKVGDFGLSYNTRFITRPSQVYLVDPSRINVIESSNYEPVYGGTPHYEDMEQHWRRVNRDKPRALRNLMGSQDRILLPLPRDPHDADPDFLSDLWSCGLIAVELMMGGVLFLDSRYIPRDVRALMGVGDDFRLGVLEIAYSLANYRRYIERGLTNFAINDYPELMQFLASIFQPRLTRARRYLTEKTVYRYRRQVTLRHIDITKVEQIGVFQRMGLRSTNSFLYRLPSHLKDTFTPRLKPEFATLKDLLDNKIKGDETQFFNLEPGIQSSFY